MYQVKFFDKNGRHLDNYDQAYIMNEAGAEQCIENFREYYPQLADATAEISEFTYVWVGAVEDPVDVACSDCESHMIPVYIPITDEELHQTQEEYIDWDRHMPSWSIKDWETEYGEPYIFTPADYNEFIQQLLDMGQIELA